MEPLGAIVCPICTLYLRPGMTLESHLASHPKQKVIEALIRVTPGYEKSINTTTNFISNTSQQINSANNNGQQHITFPNTNNSNNNNNTTTVQHTWHQPQINSVQVPNSNNTNHSFIYQQFMSSSSGGQPMFQNVPMGNPHFVAVPTVINPQMFCSPYVFHQAQQQLQIVATNPTQMVVPRQPIGLLNNEVTITPTLPSNVIVPTSVSHSQPKHVDSSTSTDPEITDISKTESRNTENALDNSNNDEIEVYPDIYADMTANEELEPMETINLTEDKGEDCIEKKEETDPISNEDNVENNSISPINNEEETETQHSQWNDSERDHWESPKSQDDTQWESSKHRDNSQWENSKHSQDSQWESLKHSQDSRWENPKHHTGSHNSSHWESSKVSHENQWETQNQSSPIQKDSDSERQKYTNIELQGEQTYKLSFPKDSIQINQVISFKEESILPTYSSQSILPTQTGEHSPEIETGTEINEIGHIYSNNEKETYPNTEANSYTQHNNYSFNEMKTNLPKCRIDIDQVSILPSSSSLVMNENVTLLELDEMNFMIAKELMSNDKTIISKVEDFECIKEANGNKILLKIGEDVCTTSQAQEETTLNIHADEHMPPRGELSESESNGANCNDWGKIYNEQECSSGMSTSYDLLARESWEGSDGSDTEMPPLQSRNPPYVTEQMEVHSQSHSQSQSQSQSKRKKALAVSYPCTTCGKSFSCPKERRVHQSKEHSSSEVSVKKIKVRLARKLPKPVIIKEENNFEIFAKAEVVENENQKVDFNPLDSLPVNKVEIKQENLCPMCGEMFTSVKEFNKHMFKTHKINSEKYKCKTCSESFPSELKFAEHLRIHPLECNLCGKNFYRKYNLIIHMKRHNNIRPHKCDICEKAFLTKQKLQEHVNIHTGNAPIKCTMCDETFRRHSNLVQHRNKHHFNIKKKYKDFVCHCGEVFHSKNKLNWHKEIHDPKPKSCTYCHEKFIHVSSLTRHIRRSHNQNYVPNGKTESENVECPICKGVYFKSSLEVHMQIHSGKRQHSCLICGKEFTTKWNLKLHKWTHASRTSKPFKCDQCNGAFIRLNDFQAHMNSHKSVRPYTCNYCGCKFIRKYNCQRHVREHEEGKSYNCTVCNKTFHRSYYLKEHMRVHSGARPFACHICGKTSTTKSNHNKHMKIHHAREPVSTEG